MATGKEKTMKKKKDKDGLPRKEMTNSVGSFPWDPMGSYTGRPYDPWEEPQQDADDL